jgi:hypothetical protein
MIRGVGLFAALAGAATLLLAGTGTASAATTLGATGGNGVADCPADYSWAQDATAVGSPSYAVPAGGGVITSWSHDRGPALATAQVRLKVFRKTAPGTYLTVGESDFETLANAGLNTFPTRVRVDGGDILGFRFTAAPISCRRPGTTGDEAVASGFGQPDPTIGSPVALGTVGEFLLNLAARVEPDCDHDGLGDQTQDTDTSCPTGQRAAALAKCKRKYKQALKKKRAQQALTTPVKQNLKKKLRKCKRRANQLPA